MSRELLVHELGELTVKQIYTKGSNPDKSNHGRVELALKMIPLLRESVKFVTSYETIKKVTDVVSRWNNDRSWEDKDSEIGAEFYAHCKEIFDSIFINVEFGNYVRSLINKNIDSGLLVHEVMIKKSLGRYLKLIDNMYLDHDAPEYVNVIRSNAEAIYKAKVDIGNFEQWVEELNHAFEVVDSEFRNIIKIM